MLPDEKFTHSDQAYLRHVFQQYILIDTESTVALLTPMDVENYQSASREGRPFSYETVKSVHVIMDRSSHKVGRFSNSFDVKLRPKIANLVTVPQ